MTDNKIISNYIQNHKENVKSLYADIQQKSLKQKEYVINKLNAQRKEPDTYEIHKSGFVKTKNRDKAKPKFKEIKVLGDEDDKILTKHGCYHKSALKKKRKFYNHFLLQETNDDCHSNSVSSNP